MAEVPVQLIVAAYETEDGAKKAVADLKKAKKEKLIAIKDAAILRKDMKGKVHISETGDLSAKQGAAFGGVVGAAIGAVAGTALAGPAVVAALVGGLASKLRDSGFDNKRLERLGRSLIPGSSALVAVVEHKWVKKIAGSLEKTGADLVTAELAQGVADQLAAGHEVAYSVLAADQGYAAWKTTSGDNGDATEGVVIGREQAVGARYVATEDGFMVETIDLVDDTVGSDFVAGMKRAGHLVGRGASEAWVSSKSAVKGAAAKRKAGDEDDD
jgi:uncharacterized membrane protein